VRHCHKCEVTWCWRDISDVTIVNTLPFNLSLFLLQFIDQPISMY
jgi:hypothetical protein